MGILGELWVKLGLKNEGLNKGLEQSKQKVSGFSKYMSKLGGMMAAAFSVKQIVAFTHQTAELANKAAGVRKAFNALNKPNLLADLRRATMGTVDDLQLMQRAVQANNFKIPLDQLATYLSFATKRANETGQSVDYLVDSIITGLGRQSVLILDNLGISAAEIRDNMKDGASMAEAVGKIIKEQMGDAATEIDNAALATGRLSAAWTNFQMAVGEETAPIWNKLKGWGAALLENATEFTANAPAWKKWVSALFPVVGTGLIFGGSDSASGNATTGTQGGTPTEETKKETKAVIPLIKALKDEIQAKEDLRNLSANQAEIRQLNNEIEALEEKLKLIQMSTKELKKYNEERIKERNAQSAKIEKVDGLFNVLEMQANLKSAKDVMDQAHKEWADGAARLNEQAIAQQAATLEAIEMLNQAVNAGITNSLGELANAIAGVEGANIGSVIKALLSPLADACISAGLLVITSGKAIEAFKASLLSLNGGVAITAGAALIAIGVAAKAGLAAIGKGATNTGGYANQNVTSYSGGYGINANNYAQNNEFTLTSTLKGQDILLSIQRTQNNNRR
jgi:cell pole-organizing protein PopZ